MDTDNFIMFLYAGILAPITEEILFRGVVQRTLLPWGRRSPWRRNIRTAGMPSSFRMNGGAR